MGISRRSPIGPRWAATLLKRPAARFACTRCGAAVGELCRSTKTGKPIDCFHAVRVRAGGLHNQIRLESWAVVFLIKDAYTAPESRMVLRGYVSGHPIVSDGFVITSPIAAVRGRIITTESGSEYELGTPDPAYIEWCRARGKHVPTALEPIKVIT